VSATSASRRNGARTPSMGSTKAVKKNTRVSGVLRATSVQIAANHRRTGTGEMRNAVMTVPRTRESPPDTANSSTVIRSPPQNSGMSDQSCVMGSPSVWGRRSGRDEPAGPTTGQ